MSLLFQRDFSVDIARGLAIVLMVGANLAPSLGFDPPHWLRWLYSLAAPTFLLLAGLMIGQHALKGRQARVWRRMALLLALAAFNDVAAYGVMPFIGMDVLYVIALGLPLCWIATRLSSLGQAALIAATLAMAYALRSQFGYASYPAEWELGAWPPLDRDTGLAIISNWLWQGWFPLFPWVAIMLAGVALARLRYGAKPQGTLSIALALCIVGAMGWAVTPGDAFVREGYAELFYPPTTALMLLLSGFGMLLLAAAVRIRLTPLALMGRHALLCYLAHTLLIAHIIAPYAAPLSPLGYIGVWAAMLTTLYAMAHLRQRLAAPAQSAAPDALSPPR